MLDLTTNKGNSVVHFSDTDIDTVQWVNDDRLIFETRDLTVGVRDSAGTYGLFAVNKDGGSLRQLNGRGRNAKTTATMIEEKHLPYQTQLLPQLGAQDSDFIYLTVREPDAREGASVNLARVNTLTGRHSYVKRPPEAHSWLLDGKGEPRMVVGHDNNVTNVYYRGSQDGEWVKISSGPTFGLKGTSFRPLAFGPGSTIYVKANKGTEDKESVYVYDYKTSKLSDRPLIETTGCDFSGALLTREGKVIGARFVTDALGTVWMDEDMKALQARIDSKFPATNNIISVAARPQTPWVAVRAFSDMQPSVYLLFNRDTGAIMKIGDSRPGIDPAKMGPQRQVTFKARDGMEIPALLTLPNGKDKNLPLVVLVHGGPNVRGSVWGWSAESQFLASRGYAVIEPSFRGTTGFGARHYKAGWKQWGLAMQDDLADSVNWAVGQGIADAGRVCIAGGSYGGYAAMMGLIKHHDMYKCGINWVGVSDFDLLVNGHWSFRSDMTSAWRDYGVPDIVGDIVKDAEQLTATSPLANASKLKRPLLMAYGGADRRVPIYHGDKFYKAVKATNPDVEMVVYPEEGHGFQLPRNRYDFYGRMEKFLERHIGK